MCKILCIGYYHLLNVTSNLCLTARGMILMYECFDKRNKIVKFVFFLYFAYKIQCRDIKYNVGVRVKSHGK